MQDYNAIWSQNNTVLACVHTTSTVLPPWLIPLAVVFSFLLVTLMTAAALVVWLRVKVLLRRRWQREKELLKNRLKGVPNGGPASIVVTDVESYSGAPCGHCNHPGCHAWDASSCTA